MISHNAEVTVNASRGRVLQLLSDPVTLTALLGHFSNFHKVGEGVYDVNLTVPVGERAVSLRGVMKGPDYYFSRVGYTGSSLDERVKWSFAFEVRERNELSTVVRVFASFDVRAGLLGRFSGLVKAIASMPQHIVEDHVKPYLLRFSPLPSAPINVQPVVLFAEEGELNPLFGKALNVARTVGTAVMLIDTGRTIGVIVFKDSKAEKVRVIRGFREEEVDDVNALLSILSEGRAKVAVYTFDVNEIIEEVIDSAFAAKAVRRDEKVEEK